MNKIFVLLIILFFESLAINENKNIKSIIFFPDEFVKSHGRMRKRMNCIDGLCYHQPNSIICDNIGFDNDHKIKWNCQAIINKKYQLSHYSILCESTNDCLIYYGIEMKFSPSQQSFSSMTDDFIFLKDIVIHILFKSYLIFILMFVSFICAYLFLNKIFPKKVFRF